MATLPLKIVVEKTDESRITPNIFGRGNTELTEKVFESPTGELEPQHTIEVSFNSDQKEDLIERFTSGSEVELAKLSEQVSENLAFGTDEAQLIEQTVIDLNKKAMWHLNREKVFGYGVIDEA